MNAFIFLNYFVVFLLQEPHRVSTVPRRHHDLTLFEQQEMAATFPAAVDLLYERGQVLQTLPSSLFKEEQLQDRRIDEDVDEKCLYSNDSCCRLDLRLGLVKKKKSFSVVKECFFKSWLVLFSVGRWSDG